MDALAFVESSKPAEPQPVNVLAGDERFLKRLALERIERLVLGPEASDFARTVYDGDSTSWAAVRDELETLPFLSPQRLVMIRDADGFVSQNREALERYLEAPSRTGTLVLDIKSWKSNTRLAKALPDRATIRCEAPAAHRLPAWCSQWATKRHGKQLNAAAGNLLVELVGAEMGVLDQELAKLAAYAGDKPAIEPGDVDTLVGHSRVETAWRMLDALADGQARQALTALQHLLDQGEDAIAVLGAMSWQLRRLAQAAGLMRQGASIAAALSQAGLPPFAQRRGEQQLRRLGARAADLYDWLLEADLALKSSGGLRPQAVLERLLVKLASGGNTLAPSPSASGAEGRGEGD